MWFRDQDVLNRTFYSGINKLVSSLNLPKYMFVTVFLIKFSQYQNFKLDTILLKKQYSISPLITKKEQKVTVILNLYIVLEQLLIIYQYFYLALSLPIL